MRTYQRGTTPMAYIAPTQTTDIDRTDNIGPVVRLAGKYRATADTRDADERDLVAAAKGGSEPATVELVARHEARIRALVTRYRTGDAPDPDRQQAALEGVIAAIHADDNDGQAAFFTLAHRKIVDALREVNAAYSDKPTDRHAESHYWAAMTACDGDVLKARRYSGLLRMSAVELEPLAEGGDMLAREIVDTRFDRWERAVRRDPDAPLWEATSQATGRGLDGPTFDAIHATVSYLDASVDLGDGEGDTAHDTTGDPDAGDEFEGSTERIALEQMIQTLEPRDQLIIRRHLDGETDRAIADALELSRPRVVNLRAAIIRRFRKLAEG